MTIKKTEKIVNEDERTCGTCMYADRGAECCIDPPGDRDHYVKPSRPGCRHWAKAVLSTYCIRLDPVPPRAKIAISRILKERIELDAALKVAQEGGVAVTGIVGRAMADELAAKIKAAGGKAWVEREARGDE